MRNALQNTIFFFSVIFPKLIKESSVNFMVYLIWTSLARSFEKIGTPEPTIQKCQGESEVFLEIMSSLLRCIEVPWVFQTELRNHIKMVKSALFWISIASIHASWQPEGYTRHRGSQTLLWCWYICMLTLTWSLCQLPFQIVCIQELLPGKYHALLVPSPFINYSGHWQMKRFRQRLVWSLKRIESVQKNSKIWLDNASLLMFTSAWWDSVWWWQTLSCSGPPDGSIPQCWPRRLRWWCHLD